MSAGAAYGESITFLIQSDHPNIVSVEFYSQNSSTAWPGGDEVYVIKDNQVNSYPLSCSSGETICYGAWVKGNESSYWGTGRGGKNSCSDCCYVCSGGETPIRVLNQ
jgi:hypothetical protein